VISQVFIARPRLAAVISIVITIAGLVALGSLPVAQFPDIVPPQVAVTASFPGADAETVETSVAQPIEDAVIGVDNMIYMKSTSGADGSYSLIVSFAVGTDPDIAAVNVQNRVALAEAMLPEDVRRTGVSTKKQSAALLQAISVYSESGDHDEIFLSNFVRLNLLDQLKRVPGIGDVVMFGPRDFAMRVELDTDRLTSLGVTAADAVAAIRAQNVQAAIGRIGAQPMADDPVFQLNLTTEGRLTEPEEFADIVVRAMPDGSFVRLRDIGRVEIGAANYDTAARVDGLFRLQQLALIPLRIYGGTMESPVLVAIPMFIFMGIMLEKSGIARDLLMTLQVLLRRVPGGLALSVTLMGTIMAATTEALEVLHRVDLFAEPAASGAMTPQMMP
jgi:hydrophobic/amphiphilic exporter-1 (mainly G- bacteria), HAE1 family